MKPGTRATLRSIAGDTLIVLAALALVRLCGCAAPTQVERNACAGVGLVCVGGALGAIGEVILHNLPDESTDGGQ